MASAPRRERTRVDVLVEVNSQSGCSAVALKELRLQCEAFVRHGQLHGEHDAVFVGLEEPTTLSTCSSKFNLYIRVYIYIYIYPYTAVTNSVRTACKVRCVLAADSLEAALPAAAPSLLARAEAASEPEPRSAGPRHSGRRIRRRTTRFAFSSTVSPLTHTANLRRSRKRSPCDRHPSTKCRMHEIATMLLPIAMCTLESRRPPDRSKSHLLV